MKLKSVILIVLISSVCFYGSLYIIIKYGPFSTGESDKEKLFKSIYQPFTDPTLIKAEKTAQLFIDRIAERAYKSVVSECSMNCRITSYSKLKRIADYFENVEIDMIYFDHGLITKKNGNIIFIYKLNAESNVDLQILLKKEKKRYKICNISFSHNWPNYEELLKNDPEKRHFIEQVRKSLRRNKSAGCPR